MDKSVSTKEKETKDDPMQQMVKMMHSMQKGQEEITDGLTQITKDVRELQGKHIEKPKGFQGDPERDENVPKEVSRIVRSIIGNDVKLRGIGTPDMPGFDLEVTIPDSLHTPSQIKEANVQREDLIMKEGKVVGRKMVTYKTKDRRTKFISNVTATADSKKLAEGIADNIRRAFERSKLPEPDFFK